MNATVGGWPSGSTVCFTPMLFPEVLNAKQGNSICHFSSLWFDSTGYRTPTYRVQSDHSTTGYRAHGGGCNGHRVPILLLSQRHSKHLLDKTERAFIPRWASRSGHQNLSPAVVKNPIAVVFDSLEITN